jgi:putative Ca2+/H+ antiporter (TMEM165/GDT1 family)
MVSSFFLSFGVIFVAELGDKSQLMAMAFAARYKALPVLIGISIATAVTHAMSVALGAVVGSRLPTDAIAIIAGIAFLIFAAWTLRGDALTEEEAEAAQKNTRNAVIAASIAFFLAELGDKTMLATITLAAKEDVFGTWLGSTLVMV